jgi:hypothetical protein
VIASVTYDSQHRRQGIEAINGQEPASVEALLGLADACLYKSKDAGRNQVTMPERFNAIAGPPLCSESREWLRA